jgi:acetyl esterase
LAEGYLLTRDVYAWYRANYIASFPDPTDWHLSPLFAEDLNNLAPAVVLYAGFDPLRDEAIVYSARLSDAGVPVEPIFFPGMMHGFITLGKVIPAANVAIRRIAEAMDALLSVRPTPTSVSASGIANSGQTPFQAGADI